MAINDYCLPDDIRDAMPGAEISPTADRLLTKLITRASRLIDGYFMRPVGAFFIADDTTRYYDGSGSDILWIDELAAAPTSVAVAEVGDITNYLTYASTEYLLWPYNALVDGMPYLRLDLNLLYGSKFVWYKFPKSVKIVGKFGFSVAVPDEIAEAVIIQSVRWYKRGQQAFQDTGAIVDLSQLKFVKELDPDVKTLLDQPKFQRITI